jgi:hypothetical protein
MTINMAICFNECEAWIASFYWILLGGRWGALFSTSFVWAIIGAFGMEVWGA